MAALGAATLHIGVGGHVDVAIGLRIAVGSSVGTVAMGPAIFVGTFVVVAATDLSLVPLFMFNSHAFAHRIFGSDKLIKCNREATETCSTDYNTHES
jgi:hypothetical protein